MGNVSFQEAYAVAAEHFNAKRFREAEHILVQILAISKDQADCLHMLGLVNHQLGRGTAGVELVRRAIDVLPTNPHFHTNLGALLGGFGNEAAALAALDRALELSPNLPEAHNGRGNILRTQGRMRDALQEFQQAVAAQPDYPDALNNLAGVLIDFYRPDEAIPLLERALQLRPNWPDTHNALGNALQLQNRFQEALNAYRKALELNPRFLDAHTNLGNAMRAQNRLDEAVHSYRNALAIDPRSQGATWGMGFISLLKGDFIPGFISLEARHFHQDRLTTFAEPAWNGEDVKGKRIMLVAEQGLGDTIQFVRYAPLIKSLGAEVAVICHPELERLLKTCAGIDLGVSNGQSFQAVSYRCPMMSAARVLRTTLETIPAQVPYLSADAANSKAWRERVEKLPPGLRVGVQWTGDPRHRNNANRSIPREMLERLSKIANVRLFSLQKGIQPSPNMTDWTSDLSDMADTAALIANLDLVISVDTSMCHLAGALAIPVWTLIPFAPDWRWLLDRPDSPWYPTMRLFRQPVLGDWETPMARVYAELESLAAQPGR